MISPVSVEAPKAFIPDSTRWVSPKSSPTAFCLLASALQTCLANMKEKDAIFIIWTWSSLFSFWDQHELCVYLRQEYNICFNLTPGTHVMGILFYFWHLSSGCLQETRWMTSCVSRHGIRQGHGTRLLCWLNPLPYDSVAWVTSYPLKQANHSYLYLCVSFVVIILIINCELQVLSGCLLFHCLHTSICLLKTT